MHEAPGKDRATALRSAAPPERLILIAIGDEWVARSLETLLLARGFAVLRTDDGRRALDDAIQVGPDAIVADVDLPGLDGIGLCRAIGNEERLVGTPVVIAATGDLTREQRLDAYRAGAWEVTRLPTDPEAFVLKLEVFADAKHAAEAIREEGLLDHATGLYNRRGLLRRAAEAVSHARRLGRSVSCFVISVERDASSWDPAADATELIEVANTLRTSVRNHDMIARLGEDDFVLIAPDTDRSGAATLAQRLAHLRMEERTAESSADKPAGKQASIRFRMGCYVTEQIEEVDPTALVLRATAALQDLQSAADPATVVRFYSE